MSSEPESVPVLSACGCLPAGLGLIELNISLSSHHDANGQPDRKYTLVEEACPGAAGYERLPEASSGFSHETLSPLRALTVHGPGGPVAGQQHSNPSSPGIPTPASSVSPVLSHSGMENPFADKAHLPLSPNLPARSRSPMSGMSLMLHAACSITLTLLCGTVPAC